MKAYNCIYASKVVALDEHLLNTLESTSYDQGVIEDIQQQVRTLQIVVADLFKVLTEEQRLAVIKRHCLLGEIVEVEDRP